MRMRLWIGFVMLFLLVPFLGSAQTQQRRAIWYAPIEADFRSEYNRDTANQSRQSWRDYFEWVQSFYAGGFMSAGWTSQGRMVIANVRNAAAQQELQDMLNALGRKIAKEWAKDNSVRKINTGDLSLWGRTFADARYKDNGSGARIKQVILYVSSQADRKVGYARN